MNEEQMENSQETQEIEGNPTEDIQNSDEPAVSEEEMGTVVAESELVYLQRIDASLEHIDSTVEYGVCLLIVLMLIVILNYIYKFFKLFF